MPGISFSLFSSSSSLLFPLFFFPIPVIWFVLIIAASLIGQFCKPLWRGEGEGLQEHSLPQRDRPWGEAKEYHSCAFFHILEGNIYFTFVSFRKLCSDWALWSVLGLVRPSWQWRNGPSSRDLQSNVYNRLSASSQSSILFFIFGFIYAYILGGSMATLAISKPRTDCTASRSARISSASRRPRATLPFPRYWMALLLHISPFHFHSDVGHGWSCYQTLSHRAPSRRKLQDQGAGWLSHSIWMSFSIIV